MPPTTILDLPLELFRAILAECIRARTISRAFRLRLVNRAFAIEVPQVVHEFRLLDEANTKIVDTGNFGIEYVFRRLIGPKPPPSCKLAHLRQVAAQLEAEDGGEGPGYEHYVRILTTQALTSSGFNTVVKELGSETMQDLFKARCHCNWCHVLPDPSGAQKTREMQQEYVLMAAAVYTNKLSIIKELISNPKNLQTRQPNDHTAGILGSPFLAAVQSGNAAALDMLLEGIAPIFRFTTKKDLLGTVSFHGSLQLLEKCIPEWPKPKWLQNTQTAEYILQKATTPNVDNFKRIMGIMQMTSNWPLKPYQLDGKLESSCRYGWVDMARHLIEIGASVQKSNPYTWPLKSAAWGGNAEILQLLFDHGAEIEGGEIEEAAHRMNWDAVWILVEHGADVDGAIRGVVKSERPDILLALIGRGANLEGEVGWQALDLARQKGLDSMALIIEGLLDDERYTLPLTTWFYL